MNRRQWIRKTNTTKLFHTVWIIVLALWGGSNSVYAEEVETWTSVSGVHLEARFVRIEGDLVVLQPTEGAPQSIRITQLVPADQVRARTLQEQAVKGTSDQPMAQLPGLDADPKSTRYAVYSCDTFDAEVLRTGVMMIYPKVNGTRVEPPIRLRTMIAAKEAQEHRRHWLIEEFVEFDRPQVDMATLSYTALAGGSEKATFRVDYTFKDGTVCLAAHILSPRQETTIHWLRVEAFFAGMEEIQPDWTAQRIKEYVQPYSLTYRHANGRWTTQNFYQSLTIRTDVDEVKSVGTWGPLTVHIEADNRNDGVNTRIFNYPGRPLHHGYQVCQDIVPGSRGGTFCIRIE